MKAAEALDLKRISLLSALAFFMISGYANVRPTIESLFIKQYGTGSLPYAWLLTAVFSAITIAIYNRYNVRYTLVSLLGWTSLASAALFTIFLALLHFEVPGALFPLYILKDIYIILQLEIFWSFANVVFTIQKARWIYGLLLSAGSIAGIFGNLAIGVAAQHFGSQNVLWGVLPQLVLCWLITLVLRKNAPDAPPSPTLEKENHLGHSLEVVYQSKYLTPLLLLVGVVQITISLIDFEFNHFLETVYPGTDDRTQIIGKTYAAIDFSALVLQTLSGPVLRIFGVGTTLIAIPVLLAATVMAFLAAPLLPMMMAAKIISKTLDYSIFRVAKEILYIPLTRIEKTQGKALIDILMYRVAKGLSSLVVAGLVAIHMAHFTMTVALSLELVWILLSAIIIKRFRTVVSFDEEMAIHQRKSDTINHEV